MLEAVPYRDQTVLTNNGIRFAEQPRNRNTITCRPMRFDKIGEGQPGFATGSRTVAGGIEERLTKPNHPWTYGQVERMNRTIKQATVRRFHYESRDPTSRTFWQPRNSPAARRRAWSHTTNTAAKSGPYSRIDPSSTRSTRGRD